LVCDRVWTSSVIGTSTSVMAPREVQSEGQRRDRSRAATDRQRGGANVCEAENACTLKSIIEQTCYLVEHDPPPTAALLPSDAAQLAWLADRAAIPPMGHANGQ
jgi:hypothetical protein